MTSAFLTLTKGRSRLKVTDVEVSAFSRMLLVLVFLLMFLHFDVFYCDAKAYFVVVIQDPTNAGPKSGCKRGEGLA